MAKLSAYQCRRHKRQGFDPWAGKIPRKRTRQLTPLFLSAKLHGQRSLAGYTVLGIAKSQTRLSMHKEADVTTSHGAARKRVALIYLGLPASGHKNDTVAQKSKIRLIFLMWTACSQRRAK